jgi:UDP-N-acetylmuramate dehydrogenase
MNENEIAALAGQLGCDVYPNEPLAKHTTFRIGGPCRYMISPKSAESLSELVKKANDNKIRTLLLGKGSNMLCADEGFDGVVFTLDNNFSEIKMLDSCTIYAQAGASLIKVCRFALEHGLSGLEFAYGIPGTVGGGIYMNAGAYGGEIKDVLESADAIDSDGNVHTYSANQLDFTYRKSRFAYSDEIIIGGKFKLKPAEKEAIESRMNELMNKRKEKQPLEYPNAGSTFKRPEGQFAGKLIQDSGLRGVSVGGAQVSEKHCGFVINKGGATSNDVKALISHIQKTVLENTGFRLECEIKIIPYKDI